MEWLGRRWGLSLWAAGATLTGLSCGGDDVTNPSTGGLEITTSTNGPEPDPDGYAVSIDGGAEAVLGVNATLQLDDLEPGTHSVRLAGIAANCTVAGENPRTVNIPAGETATVAFQLTCRPTTGSLQVTAATAGPSPDAGGYSITLDGTDRGALGLDEAVTIEGLTAGNHVVGLSGIAGNCRVEGENPRAASITAGASATVAFDVICVPPPSVTGSLRITTATTGSDPDPDGYTFALDGGYSQPIGLNTSVTLTNVAVGAHTVRLSDIGANCTAGGTDTRSTSVSANVTAPVSFSISCSATTGTIQVSVATSGPDPDPDGYVVRLDAGATRATPTAGTVSFPDVPAGSHTIELSGVTANCTVAEGPSRNVTVTAGERVEVGFSVVCTPTTGSITVTTATTGFSLDLDGYTVAIQGRAPIAIERDGTRTFGVLQPGEYQIVLADLTTNCRPDGSNPRGVSVTPGVTATISFAVTCSARLVFVGRGQDHIARIYSMNADGTDVIQLTQGGNDLEPVCSPDGSKIAFVRRSPGLGSSTEVFLMNADGTGQTRLMTRGARDLRWSPDGAKIAFVDYGDPEIYVINADGSGLTNLTNYAGYDDYPAWSPDGSKIAFTRGFPKIVNGTRETVYHIAVMNADGSGQRRLTSSGDKNFGAIWSPDGGRILFNRGININHNVVHGDVWTMAPDGTDQTNLTNTPIGDAWQGAGGGVWSPDGGRIVFSDDTETGFSHDIYVMNNDGTSRTNLTNSPTEGEYGANWSPDGSKIAFVGLVTNNRDAIFIMNSDGTGRMTLMERASSPVWRP